MQRWAQRDTEARGGGAVNGIITRMYSQPWEGKSGRVQQEFHGRHMYFCIATACLSGSTHSKTDSASRKIQVGLIAVQIVKE